MKKVIRLTETELVRLVKKVISEQSMGGGFTPQFQAAELSKINSEDLVGKFLGSREKIETKAKLLYNPSNINNKI